ncbi:SDR family oxidoreductase [Saccharopolyspora griseoalba]|uniref:SDR family oxidoreductase n=1 Tax=Saccharopolyspora griseoalba TaxID=1431848 RepID=A0ABW2LJR8_9PSEU
MRIVIAGAHGKIARQLGALLAQRGDSVLGLVRNPDHATELAELGMTPEVVDMEIADAAGLAARLSGVDAAVFAAGAGPGSGAERKDTVDRGASVLLAESCQRAGVRRFVQISSMGTRNPNPPDVDPVFGAYLDAKRAAEQDLRQRDLEWTILRPGRLTDDPPTGRVTLGPEIARDAITRSDVAEVVLALLDEPRTAGMALEAVNGDVPVTDAVRNAVE